MSIFDLTFGIEIECYLPANVTRAQAVDAITQRLGGTNICREVPYSLAHRPTTYWKLTTDGSLGDYQRGIEVVSPALPPLKGIAGLHEVTKVCQALTDLGCTITTDCGFHVHVGVGDQPMRFWKNIVRLYQAYEPVIDGFMPRSRRESRSSWCRTLTTTNVPVIENAATVAALGESIRSATGAREPRYHKVNVDAYHRHKTVEFRQHSGTTDATKSRMWVLTCLRMVEAAKGTLAFGTTQAPRNRARYGTKAWQIGQMLLRPEGATGPEVCAAMNWPRVSMPAQARAAGLDVYSQRTGRVVRYYVRQMQPAAALDLTLDGLCNLLGSAQDERSYLKTRTTNLSGAVPWAA